MIALSLHRISPPTCLGGTSFASFVDERGLVASIDSRSGQSECITTLELLSYTPSRRNFTTFLAFTRKVPLPRL